MGTKAFFSVETKPGFHCTTIIGMTWDGTPNNLEYIAQCFEDKMKKLRKKTVVLRGNTNAIIQVLESVVVDHEDWLFIDEIKNVQWISHSALYSPKKGILRLYEGQLEDFDKDIIIKKK